MKRSMRSLKNPRKGQAIVEFAMVLTVFSMIVFGIIEWGRLWMTMNALTSAAREGVRIAAVTGPDLNLVRGAALNILDAANLNGVLISTSGPDADNEVTVTIRMDYSILSGTIIPGLNGTIQLTRSAAMHWEG